MIFLLFFLTIFFNNLFCFKVKNVICLNSEIVKLTKKVEMSKHLYENQLDLIDKIIDNVQEEYGFPCESIINNKILLQLSPTTIMQNPKFAEDLKKPWHKTLLHNEAELEIYDTKNGTSKTVATNLNNLICNLLLLDEYLINSNYYLLNLKTYGISITPAAEDFLPILCFQNKHEDENTKKIALYFKEIEKFINKEIGTFEPDDSCETVGEKLKTLAGTVYHNIKKNNSGSLELGNQEFVNKQFSRTLSATKPSTSESSDTVINE